MDIYGDDEVVRWVGLGDIFKVSITIFPVFTNASCLITLSRNRFSLTRVEAVQLVRNFLSNLVSGITWSGERTDWFARSTERMKGYR